MMAAWSLVLLAHHHHDHAMKTGSHMHRNYRSLGALCINLRLSVIIFHAYQGYLVWGLVHLAPLLENIMK
jgi:hypothetical protein